MTIKMCFLVENRIGVVVYESLSGNHEDDCILFYSAFMEPNEKAQYSIDTLTKLFIQKNARVYEYYLKIWLNNCDRKKPFIHPDEVGIEW